MKNDLSEHFRRPTGAAKSLVVAGVVFGLMGFLGFQYVVSRAPSMPMVATAPRPPATPADEPGTTHTLQTSSPAARPSSGSSIEPSGNAEPSRAVPAPGIAHIAPTPVITRLADAPHASSTASASTSVEPAVRRNTQPASADCANATFANGYAINEVRRIFDLAPTAAIEYADPGGDFFTLRGLLADAICAWAPWPEVYPPVLYRLVLISPAGAAQMLVGDHWIGDGVHLVPITAQDFAQLQEIINNRRNSAGPHLSREAFEQLLAGRGGLRNPP